MIGGQGVFETLRGGTLTNLLPASPFLANGVFAAAWNGSSWLVGGGGAAAVAVVGEELHPTAALPTAFDHFVTFIAAIQGGWLVGGEGTAPDGVIDAELVYGPSLGSRSEWIDLSSQMPTTFSGGRSREDQCTDVRPEFVHSGGGGKLQC